MKKSLNGGMSCCAKRPIMYLPVAAKSGCPVCIGAQEAGMGMKQDVGSLLQTLAGGERNVI